MMKQVFTAFVCFTFLLLACGGGATMDHTGDAPKSRGEMIYDTHCVLCHGGDGKLGINEAKDLTVSPLTKAEMIILVANGRGTMMPYRNVLDPDEIEAVVEHVRTLGERE